MEGHIVGRPVMTFLNALSMRKKLLLTPALAASLMVISAMAAMIGMRQQWLSLQSISQERIPAMRTAALAERNLASVQASTYKLLAMMDANFPAERVDAAKRSISSELDSLQSSLDAVANSSHADPQERTRFQAAAKSIAEYRKIIDDVMDVASVQVSMGTAYMSKAQTKYEELTVQFKQLREFEDKNADAAHNSAASVAVAAVVGVVVALLLSVVLSVALALYVARNIVYSIDAIRHLTGKLSEGDLGDDSLHLQSGAAQHGIDLDRKDEIGELGRSFARLVQYLRDMAATSEAIAGGDLTAAVEPRCQADTLGHAFLRMIQGLRQLVRSVRDNASEVTSASRQIAVASEDAARVGGQASSAIAEVSTTMEQMSVNLQSVVKNTQMQNSSVSETSSSIDQMVASIQRVADTSTLLLEMAEKSGREVETGISSMGRATDGLNRINKSIRSSAQTIQTLGDRTHEIDKIVEVIDDLAEQTNLLALNAAIEAARAGEHGMGFAVVAEEVRKLAEKSAQSTQEISSLIRGIQSEAQEAVSNMSQSTTIVDEGLALGADLNSALDKISTVVAELNKFAKEIGAATREQAYGSEQIAKATSRLNEITCEITSSVEEQATGTQAVAHSMEKMREVVQRSTSSSTELAASAEQMSRMSQRLLEAMQRFKLDVRQSEQATQRRQEFQEFAAVHQ